jgi:broad specificity phosphatase PhoE
MGVVELLLVRHGESVGNVAAASASESGADTIDVEMRDADVPLSQTGVEQAHALGAGLARLAEEHRPDAVWCSPYRRAEDTARLALEAAGLSLPLRVDERLRDRDLGVLDLLTTQGVAARFPEEAARRRWLGKFYHRPPGGESWADMALRIRTLLSDLDRLEEGRRVLLVCHDAVVMTVRYVCEQLTESQVLEIASDDPVRNVSLTRLRRDPDDAVSWTLDTYNDVRHLEERDVEVTRSPGDPHAVA